MTPRISVSVDSLESLADPREPPGEVAPSRLASRRNANGLHQLSIGEEGNVLILVLETRPVVEVAGVARQVG